MNNAALAGICLKPFWGAGGRIRPRDLFEMSERLVVARALQIVRKLRIERPREIRLQSNDRFRSRFKLFEMRRRIPLVKLAIANDRQAFAQRRGERGVG